MTKRLWSVAMLCSLASAAPCAAQGTKVELVPYVGAYVPVNSLAKISVVSLQGDSSTIKVNQKAALVLGGRLDVWFKDNLGVEGNFAYAFSDGTTEVTGVPGTTDICDDLNEDCNANVWLASGKLIYRYTTQPDASWAILAGAGISLVGHTGAFWEDAEGTTDVGGVVDLGAVFDVSDRIGIRIDVEDYFYGFNVTADLESIGPVEAGTRVQNDLVFSGGVVIGLNN